MTSSKDLYAAAMAKEQEAEGLRLKTVEFQTVIDSAQRDLGFYEEAYNRAQQEVQRLRDEAAKSEQAEQEELNRRQRQAAEEAARNLAQE